MSIHHHHFMECPVCVELGSCMECVRLATLEMAANIAAEEWKKHPAELIALRIRDKIWAERTR